MTRGFLLPLLAALLPLGALAAGSAQQPVTNETAPGGPGRLCFRDSSLDLLEGEAVQLTAGVHGVRLEISGPAGRFTYSENEMFAEPRTAGEPVSVRAGLRVARHRRQGATSYLFHGPIAAYRDGKTRPVVWIGGEALAGGAADLAILARVRTGPPDGCMRRYDYGWESAPPPGQNAQ
ncbi:MAG TPA: hypothetical protein VEX35_12605 [Allosphingosinicella sp.]|nr:hypothetical protein [Allosphingosinicella sp.]